MKNILLTLGLLSTCFLVWSQKVHYTLGMSKPQSHYFEVEMDLEGFKEKVLEVKMPVWAPGSYLVREFSKNVNLVKAFDENGKTISVKKTSKNTWSISKGKASKVKVKYEVYSFELSVRTSFLDLTHGFVSGSGVFMYVNGHKDRSGTLEVIPYKDFNQVTTAMTRYQKHGFNYSFASYDELADSPIEIGTQEVFSFTAAGVDHTVAMYGPGNYNIEVLQKDMARIVESATGVFGQNPNKNYVFIIHNVVDGQGGLEHTSSTTLSVNRWTYSGSAYIGFLSLVAHEYFHLWNVKRIRPIELGPFNYDEENYTSLLWVMEGFTSYYDELLLLRAGYYDPNEYLSKLENTINYVEGSVGSRVQPLAHSSYDAWIKAYRPNENSSNTTMTYYSRGAVMAALFDMMIISHSKGEQGLDHFLQALYDKFYIKQKRGFTEDEFRAELERFTGKSMKEFFEKYIHGTEIPPYNEIFREIGFGAEYTGIATPSFGASLRQDGGNLIVRSIRAGSSAEDAGLSVNDEILAYGDFRADQKGLEARIAEMKEGDELELLVSRDDRLMKLMVMISLYEKPSFHFIPMKNEPQKDLLNYWLRTM